MSDSSTTEDMTLSESALSESAQPAQPAIPIAAEVPEQQALAIEQAADRSDPSEDAFSFPPPPAPRAPQQRGMFPSAIGYTGSASDVSAPTSVGGATAGSSQPAGDPSLCKCFCGSCKVGDHKNCSHIDPCGAVSECGCRCGACKAGTHQHCSHINSCKMKAAAAAGPGGGVALGNVHEMARTPQQTSGAQEMAASSLLAGAEAGAESVLSLESLHKRITALELFRGSLETEAFGIAREASVVDGASDPSLRGGLGSSTTDTSQTTRAPPLGANNGEPVADPDVMAQGSVRFGRPADLVVMSLEALTLLEDKLCADVGATEERSAVLLEIGEARAALEGLGKQLTLITKVVRVMTA